MTYTLSVQPDLARDQCRFVMCAHFFLKAEGYKGVAYDVYKCELVTGGFAKYIDRSSTVEDS